MSAIIISISVTGVIAFLLAVLTLKNKHEQNKLSLIVNYMTIAIGMSTILSTVLSAYVMISQDKSQRRLIEMQEYEHQPIFAINYIKSSSDGTDSKDIEDFTIENIGEQMLGPAKISVKSYIEIEYSDYNKDIELMTYYPLAYYYNAVTCTENLTGLLMMSHHSEYIQNNKRFTRLHDEATTYSTSQDKIYVYLRKIDLFTITYTDIYGKERTCYYRNSDKSSKEAHDLITGNASKTYTKGNSLSIEEVTFEDLIRPLK